MKKSILILTAAAAMLMSCHTARIAYDERPVNKQPVLERPAWPNYDLHNDRSFASRNAGHTNARTIAPRATSSRSFSGFSERSALTFSTASS